MNHKTKWKDKDVLEKGYSGWTEIKQGFDESKHNAWHACMKFPKKKIS